MKKIISVLLICVSLMLLASCNKNKNPDNTPDPDDNPGSTQLPTEDNKIHLIVLAGQSGARGKALVKDLSEEDREANVDVDIIADGLPMGELNNIPGINRALSINQLEPGYGDFPSEFGPEIGMGQTMASRYPKFDAEYKSVIVKYTASGSTFTDHWYSTSAIADSKVASALNFDQAAITNKGGETGPLTNNLYLLVEKAIDELTELGYEVVIDGMAFVHGEQDAKFDENMAVYEKALSYFIKDFRDYFGVADMPVVVTEALTNSAKYSNELRAIQERVSAGLTNVSFIENDGLYSNTFEPWHFGAESNNVIGNRIAAEIISYNDTRVIKSIDEDVINLPLGVKVDLPGYVKASFTNYYQGYVKVESYSDYDCNKAGEQDVKFTVKTGEGLKEFSLKVNLSDSNAHVDGSLTEYSGAKKTSLPAGLGDVYVIKGESGLYIAANIKDSEIWTDGENWGRGDMGQKDNNDDFIVYITDSTVENRTTLCLSAANLLRVYNNGIALDDSDITLEFNNLVYNKKLSDYQYRATTDGLTNGGESVGVVFEIYISYEDLGITDPNSIMLCFNYNDVYMSGGAKVAEDNYLVKGDGGDNAENSIDSYFKLSELTD